MKTKSILILFQPHRSCQGSLLQMLVEAIKTTDFHVDYIDITNPPAYQYKSFSHKLRNIYHRVIHKNQQYILNLEAEFVNEFYLQKIKEFKAQNIQVYDYVLIVKPEEFSEKVIKETTALGKHAVGYIWDGLRLFFLPNLIRNKSYLKKVYSFDTNNIKENPALGLEFCTNFAVYNQEIIPYHQRTIDLFYVGDLAGRLEYQRRDIKLNRLLQQVDGNFDVNIFLNKVANLVQELPTSKINYIDEFIPIKESLERTRNSKIVIDICKAHHIGLSFRFFECLATETKIITNNKDVVNYNFYNPHNIMVVDFDQDVINQEEFDEFLRKPYEKVDATTLNSYGIENWIKYLFKIDGYETISK